MNMFGNFFGGGGGGSQPTQPAQNPTANGGQQSLNQANPNTPANPDPQQNQTPNAMDLYKGLFDAAAGEDGNSDPAPQLNISPETMSKTLERLDFTGNLPENIVGKLQNGESFDAQDIVALTNHVAKQAYAAAMQHGSTLTGKFVDLHSAHSLKSVPSVINQHLATSRVGSSPAASSNPVVQKHLQTVASQLAKLNPGATPEWIQERTEEYFVNMARQIRPDAFTPTPEEAKRQAANSSFDWDAFLQQA